MYMHLKVYLTPTDCQVTTFTEHCGGPRASGIAASTNS
jgi:hypothetical protein